MGQQHPIQNLGHRHLLLARFGKNQPVDQHIHRRILDSGCVARAFSRGGFGAPIFALLVTGRQRLRPQIGSHIEIEIAHAVFILGRIDNPHRDGNTEPLQRGFEKQQDPLEARIIGQ